LALTIYISVVSDDFFNLVCWAERNLKNAPSADAFIISEMLTFALDSVSCSVAVHDTKQHS